MNKGLLWVAVGLAAWVSACSLANAPADVTASSASGGGVLVAALGRSGAIEFSMSVKLRSVERGTTYLLKVEDDTVSTDFGKVIHQPNSPNGSEWGFVSTAEPLGRVVVASLPAGEYELLSVYGIAPRFKLPTSKFTIDSEPIGLRFTIRPGEVSYLGSIVFAFPDYLLYSHYHGSMRVLTFDTRERDQALVRQRYPNLPATLPSPVLAQAPDPSRVFKYYFHLEVDGGDAKT